MSMNIQLDWRGSIRMANLPVTSDEVPALGRPGVYIWLSAYENSLKLAYVGQATVLLGRFYEHHNSLLTLQYRLRRPNREIFVEGCSPSKSVEYAARLVRQATLLPLAEQEKDRASFFYASHDGLGDKDLRGTVEAALINQVRKVAIQSDGKLECDNSRGGSSRFQLLPLTVVSTGASEILNVVGGTFEYL